MTLTSLLPQSLLVYIAPSHLSRLHSVRGAGSRVRLGSGEQGEGSRERGAGVGEQGEGNREKGAGGGGAVRWRAGRGGEGERGAGEGGARRSGAE